MTIKAEITPVSIGFLTIEGLMSENGEFGVAVPQLASINLVPQNRSVKQLHALLGKAFPSHEIQKWKTTLNSRALWAFQSKLGIESGGRDNLTTEELIKLHGKQVKLTTLMECGFSPWQALSKI